MSDELAIIQKAQDKIEVDKRKKDVAILKQTLEPVEDKLSGLSEVLQNFLDVVKSNGKQPEYYDKELGAKVISAVAKAIDAIKQIKAPEITVDLSPINAIATEIKKGNDTLIDLIKKSNQGNTTGELFRMITAMVGKQNIFLERGFQQIDYTPKIDELIKAITRDKLEEINFGYDEAGKIRTAKPTYKT